MSGWIVYSKDGLTERCRLKSLEYSGEWMGACSVTVTIESPSPIHFEIGDYLLYRGERFEINYDPAVIKTSSVNTSGNGFEYENVVFNSLSDELTRCDFLDYVPSDNQIHYSSLPNFSFFADSIETLAERIQVNLDRVYTGEKKWTVEVHPEYVSKSNVNISVNSISCWDALALVKSQFDANFIIRNRVITIGTEGLAVEKVFSYGKGNGLIVIERNAESDQKIITRLRAYGSTRNMPLRYYANIAEGVPNNLAVNNLMLPSFPDDTLDPYIDSDNIKTLGVREGTVFFDGSGELEEIYPSMEGMTAEDLIEAGVSVSATGRLDEVVSAEQISDDGVFEEDSEISPFTITLKDIGFDINDHLATSGNATISMKDGMCGGREFEIVSCEKNEDGFTLTCNRSYDSGLDLYFPYNGYQIKQGDKFVLINIEMPDVFIKAASQRLYEAAKAYLAKNDYVRYSYTPQVDAVFMARQHDEAVKFGVKSIYETIKEGDLMIFEDADLGIEGNVIIDSLSIKEDLEDDSIPSYEITLRNDKAVGTIDKIQNQIESIVSGKTPVNNGGGGYNSSQIKSLILTYGSNYFLRKDKDDKTPYSLGVGRNLSVGGDTEIRGHLSVGNGAEIKGDTVTDDVTVNESIHSSEFVSGFTGGKGWAIRKQEFVNAAGVKEDRYVIEADDIVARGSIRVFEFIASQMLGENDNRTLSAMLEVDHYDAETGKVWLDTQSGKFYNPFREGDYVMVMQYNGEPSEQNGYYITKQYELIVTEVGVGDLSLGEDRLDWVKFRGFATIMEGGDTSLITKGDTFVRIDNVSDPDRKGIIQMMTVGENTPYIDMIYGRKTDPDNSLKGRFGNLQGIYSPLFGWLREFGTYLINSYIVGEFRIAHTGTDVSDAIEIAKGSFRTNYRQTTYDITEEDNFFTNATFTNDCENWVLSEESTEFFLVDDLPQYFNYDLYASENSFAGIAAHNDRDMLRLCNGSVKQLNSLIDKPSTHKEYSGEDDVEEVVDTIFLNIRFYCDVDGVVECGFVDSDGNFYGNDFHSSSTYEANIDAYTITLEGVWDGEGDFVIKSTGDVYIDLLSLTDDPLANYKLETSTRIEQDATKIALLGQRVSGVEGSVTNLGVELNAAEERITLYIDKEIEGVEGSVTQLQLNVDSLTSTVATAQGTANDAKSAASAAQTAANNAATKATNAQSKADANATAIEQQSDSISLISAAFQKDSSGKLVLTSAAGAVIASDMAAIYATQDGVTASLATKVSFNLTTKKITSDVIITGDKITLEGATTINNYFKINTDGSMYASRGTIGGFEITSTDIRNNNNDANIIVRNTDDWSTATKIAGIGTFIQTWPSSTGLSAMGAFIDEEDGDTSNIALVVSAKNATSNIGLWMLGGAIAGLAEKVGHYSSSGVISHSDNVAIANGTSITLPVMDAYDDGHVVTIISNYTSSTNIYCSGDNFIQNGSSKVVSVSMSALGVAKFVFVYNLEYTFPVGLKQGCWVKII